MDASRWRKKFSRLVFRMGFSCTWLTDYSPKQGDWRFIDISPYTTFYVCIPYIYLCTHVRLFCRMICLWLELYAPSRLSLLIRYSIHAYTYTCTYYWGRHAVFSPVSYLYLHLNPRVCDSRHISRQVYRDGWMQYNSDRLHKSWYGWKVVFNVAPPYKVSHWTRMRACRVAGRDLEKPKRDCGWGCGIYT